MESSANAPDNVLITQGRRSGRLSAPPSCVTVSAVAPMRISLNPGPTASGIGGKIDNARAVATRCGSSA